MTTSLITRAELIARYESSQANLEELAKYLRMNILHLVQQAGSGHIGTSFSVIDLLLGIHQYELGDLLRANSDESYRVFSSKGHDAPAIYVIDHFLGKIEDDEMILRRLGYLTGHPEIGSGASITNTGSLGMGISKAKGFSFSDRLLGREKTTYVILGDGELQEGQIWEALPGLDTDRMSRIVAVVDRNGIQSDTWTDLTRGAGDLRKRFEGSGWQVIEIDGHNFGEISSSLAAAAMQPGPSVVLANTIKGRGSEVLSNFPKTGRFYPYHSGALRPELLSVVMSQINSENATFPEQDFSGSEKFANDSMVNDWAQILLDLALSNPNLVIADGDLQLDTGTYLVAQELPSRYFQFGIAEQDMVSTAGTMALSGLIPVVSSFSTFLTMRPYEQIFNNASEGSKIIYVGFLGGLIPSAPGFSHQAVSDLAIMSAVPKIRIFEPSTLTELRACAEMALEHDGPTYIRVNSTQPVPLSLVYKEEITEGFSVLGTGTDFAIVASGSVMVGQAVGALEELMSEGVTGKVYSAFDKLNEDVGTLVAELSAFRCLVFLENANSYLGTIERLKSEISARRIPSVSRAVVGLPVSGETNEVLTHHEMHRSDISRVIRELID